MTLGADSIDSRPIYIRSGETVLVAVDMTSWGLGSGVTASSASVSDADGLTIGTPSVNASALVNRDNGMAIAIGKAVSMSVSGASAGTTYDVILSVSTSNSQTLKPKVTFVGV